VKGATKDAKTAADETENGGSLTHHS
jgi:hypothetical protein